MGIFVTLFFAAWFSFDDYLALIVGSPELGNLSIIHWLILLVCGILQAAFDITDD